MTQVGTRNRPQRKLGRLLRRFDVTRYLGCRNRCESDTLSLASQDSLARSTPTEGTPTIEENPAYQKMKELLEAKNAARKASKKEGHLPKEDCVPQADALAWLKFRLANRNKDNPLSRVASARLSDASEIGNSSLSSIGESEEDNYSAVADETVIQKRQPSSRKQGGRATAAEAPSYGFPEETIEEKIEKQQVVVNKLQQSISGLEKEILKLKKQIEKAGIEAEKQARSRKPYEIPYGDDDWESQHKKKVEPVESKFKKKRKKLKELQTKLTEAEETLANLEKEKNPPSVKPNPETSTNRDNSSWRGLEKEKTEYLERKQRNQQEQAALEAQAKEQKVTATSKEELPEESDTGSVDSGLNDALGLPEEGNQRVVTTVRFQLPSQPSHGSLGSNDDTFVKLDSFPSTIKEEATYSSN